MTKAKTIIDGVDVNKCRYYCKEYPEDDYVVNNFCGSSGGNLRNVKRLLF